MEYYWPFILFSIAMAFTPGPNNTFLMASGLNYGIKKSMPHLLGVVIGFPVMIATIGAGLGNIFLFFPWLHIILKIAGIIYLLILTWIMATIVDNRSHKKRPPFTFIQAALFQWINPKAWLMAIGTVSTYISSEISLLPQLSIIVLISFVTAIGSASTWLWFGVALQRFITSPTQLRFFNISMALLLLLSISPIIFDLLQPLFL